MFSIPEKVKDLRSEIFTPSGETKRYEYIEVIGDDGAKALKVSREIDISEYINSSLEDSLIYNILDKYARGDLSALNRATGQFLDCTGLPTSFLEAHQYVKNAENLFSQFPDDLKSKFGSFKDFQADLISGSAYDKLTSYELSKSESFKPSESEVSNNVNASE